MEAAGSYPPAKRNTLLQAAARAVEQHLKPFDPIRAIKEGLKALRCAAI